MGGMILPSDLLRLTREGAYIPPIIDLDTETSGLHVDDGARASTISVGWEDPDGLWETIVESGMHENGSQVWKVTEYGKGALGDSRKMPIVAFAWPFDQGVTYTGKPEDTGQGALIPDADNLPIEEWVALLEWLELLGWQPGCTCHHGYGTIESWTAPANTDTSTRNEPKAATASRAHTGGTKPNGSTTQKNTTPQQNDAGISPDTTHYKRTGEPVRAVAKNTRATSSSTASTVGDTNTEQKSTVDETSAGVAIKPTSGSPKTATPMDSKFYALIATWPRNEAGVPTCPWCSTDAEVREFLGFHHGKFDLHIVAAGLRTERNSGIDLEKNFRWDTQNVAHLLWSYTGTTSLKPTAERIWNEKLDDEQKKVKSYLAKAKLPSGRWDLVPWSIIGQYACLDAELTTRLRLHQQTIIAENKDGQWMDGTQGKLTLQEAVDRRLATSRMLYRMERRGLPFDTPAVGPISRELDRRVNGLVKQLPFKPATLPAAKHYWFGHGTNRNGVTGLGLTPISVTETGDPQLNANVVRKLAIRDVPGIDVWRNLQKAKTANDRWYRGWGSMVGEDGRLRGNIRQNGTVSGRFSINRVQLQAIPHDFRLGGYPALDGLTTPRGLIGQGVPDGYRLWELDLANAELRVAAMMAGCKRMLELIGEGADLHGDAAQQLFDIYPDDPKWGQMRGVAKRANFSLIFGVGWEKLQEDIDSQTGVVLSDSEAKELVYDWNRLYPEYQSAIKKTGRVVGARQTKYAKGWVQVFNGERRWFTAIEEVHKAWNQRVQPSLAQYGINWWLGSDRIVDRELELAGYGDQLNSIGMVMLIHDSVVLLLPTKDDLDKKIVKQVQDIGVALWSETFPAVVGGIDAKQWGGGD